MRISATAAIAVGALACAATATADVSLGWRGSGTAAFGRRHAAITTFGRKGAGATCHAHGEPSGIDRAITAPRGGANAADATTSTRGVLLRAALSGSLEYGLLVGLVAGAQYCSTLVSNTALASITQMSAYFFVIFLSGTLLMLKPQALMPNTVLNQDWCAPTPAKPPRLAPPRATAAVVPPPRQRAPPTPHLRRAGTTSSRSRPGTLPATSSLSCGSSSPNRLSSRPCSQCATPAR